MLDDFQKLETEYEKTKRALEIREIEVKAILAQAHELANTDVLTFLPNRRKIVSSLQEEVIRSNRYGMPLSISILDLDHFKLVKIPMVTPPVTMSCAMSLRACGPTSATRIRSGGTAARNS